MPDDTKPFDPKDLIAVHLEAIEEHRISSDAVYDNHRWAQDDVDFLQGGEHQWLEADVRSRKGRGAPCLSINPLNRFVDRVVGDMLLNKPAIKAIPVDDDSDVQTAEVISGLVSNIEHQSKSSQVWKHVGKGQVGHGFGYAEIITEYTGYPSRIDSKGNPEFTDSAFEQDIKLKKIKNSFSVIPDENSEDITLADQMKCFIERRISRKNFKQEFPGEEPTSFPEASRLYPNYFSKWFGENDLLIVKYYRRVKRTIKIIQLSDGRVFKASDLRNNKDLLDEVGPLTVENKRDAEYFEVYKYIVTGDKVIDGPVKIMSTMIPVVRAAGRTLEVGDYTIYRGLIRDAKDAQMMANYWISTIAESLTTAPKAPWLVTPEQIEGHEEIWKNSNRVNYAYLTYNFDPNQPTIPARVAPPFLPDAAFVQYQQMGVDIKNTIGLQDASLGIPSNEKSGRAIEARERQGGITTFEFIDNLNDAIVQAGKIILEMIPNVYDTRRVVRLLNPDGTVEEAILNNRVFDPADPMNVVTENDLARGKYDVRIEIGPSFTTKRQETSRQLLELSRLLNPVQLSAVSHLIVNSLDINGGDEIMSILKKLAPPGVLEPEEGEEPPQPPPPSPEQELEAAKLQVEGEKVKVDAAKLEVEKMKIAADAQEAQENKIDTEEEVREIARQEALDVIEEVGATG